MTRAKGTPYILEFGCSGQKKITLRKLKEKRFQEKIFIFFFPGTKIKLGEKKFFLIIFLLWNLNRRMEKI